MARDKGNPILWKLIQFFAIVWLIIAGGPFVYQIVTTLKTSGEFMTGNLFDRPQKFYIQNYVTVLNDGFFRYFFNSLFVLAISLFLLLSLSAFAAYPLARMKFKLNKPVFSMIVAAMSIPIHITLIPVFIMTIRFGIYDSLYALIGPNVAFDLPMSVFILTNFMKTISAEMEEAAEIDGCGKFASFFKVILPLSTPGLATLAIYNGAMIWNEFIFVMTLTQSQTNRTLPLAVWQYQGQHSIHIPLIMAVLVISSLPVILLYIFGQDRIVRGMMAGALKG